MSPREEFVQLIEGWIGWPYVYGGQSPIVGFDCSGVEVGAFWTTGHWSKKIKDKTAEGIGKYYAQLRVPFPYRGVLVFWQNAPGLVRHTEVCVGENDEGEPICVGARESYGRVVKTPLSEKRGRLELTGYVDPFLNESFRIVE